MWECHTVFDRFANQNLCVRPQLILKFGVEGDDRVPKTIRFEATRVAINGIPGVLTSVTMRKAVIAKAVRFEGDIVDNAVFAFKDQDVWAARDTLSTRRRRPPPDTAGQPDQRKGARPHGFGRVDDER